MDEADDRLELDPAARAEWVHELRNAVNTVGIAMLLTRRLLEKARPEEALSALADGLQGWERCQALLERTTAATCLPAGYRDDTPAPPPPHN